MDDTIKEELEKSLAKICWKLSPRGCDHYSIHDHKGKHSGYMFFANRIECRRQGNSTMAFNLENCEITILGGKNDECVSISPNGDTGEIALIQFYNHDR